ncbi:MAG: resolvase [Alphaproteobacteria bacterium HGW-Alphaproteobacteria-14]|nr:MAG: resolvase [Alphaproteobacteria bacterium HGW-Alphaproteobacteria-14]
MTPAEPPRFIAYFRVSTDKQGRSGLGLEAQRASVEQFVSGTRGGIIAEFIEVESGTRSDRPKLADALRLCRIHSATLVIAKLDRLARNVAFISNLMESGVDFTAVDFPSANRLTIHILAAVAEHEAHIIRERTKTALAAAKARGVALGGNRGNLAGIALSGARASARVRRQSAERKAADLKPIVDEMLARRCSYRAMADELNARSIPTPRGGLWGVSQVFRLVQLSKAVS